MGVLVMRFLIGTIISPMKTPRALQPCKMKMQGVYARLGGASEMDFFKLRIKWNIL